APDPWQVLGLERRLALDAAALADRHRELLTASHPDRFAAAPEAERAAALERASAVNDAGRVLSDPEARAQRFLELEGAAGHAGTPPTEMLQEIYDLRTAMDEALDRGDDDEV